MGRHAVDAGLAAGRAFDTGYEAVRKPFEEPGAEIDEAEPFAPGTVSGGAIVAKSIRNLVAGSRSEANAREALRVKGEARQMGELERTRMQQQIEEGTLQDYADPTTGKTVQLPAGDIRRIISDRIRYSSRPAPRPAATRDPTSSLQKSLDALNARVDRESEIDFQQRAMPLLTDIERRASAGDLQALKVLGLPGTLADYVKKSNPDALRLVSEAVKRRAEAYQNEVRTNVRGRYQQHYDAIERALQESGGLTQGGDAGAAPEGDTGEDPLLDSIRRMLDEEESGAQ